MEFRQLLGKLWATSGQPLGNHWAGTRHRLGNVWATVAQSLGNFGITFFLWPFGQLFLACFPGIAEFNPSAS